MDERMGFFSTFCGSGVRSFIFFQWYDFINSYDRASLIVIFFLLYYISFPSFLSFLFSNPYPKTSLFIANLSYTIFATRAIYPTSIIFGSIKKDLFELAFIEKTSFLETC